MYLPKTCFAGRILIRHDLVDGLDWRTPCPIPPEEVLPFDPPMYFCAGHFTSAVDTFWDVLDRAGLIDHGIARPPADEFDEIVTSLRSQE